MASLSIGLSAQAGFGTAPGSATGGGSGGASGTAAVPFAAFRFSVEINRGGTGPLCAAAFSECDGLEVTLDVKTVREGGDNGSVRRLPGPASFSNLTLKRGMTSSTDLWDWVDATIADPTVRADVTVVFHPSDSLTAENARFVLSRCIPVKIKAPALNAKDGIIAIEELQLAYESLTLKRT
jgi:phage tail-like protein